MGRTSAQQKIGNKIRTLRKEMGWSQEKLSLATKVDRKYISGIERGQRNPSLQTLAKLAKALKVKVSEITDF